MKILAISGSLRAASINSAFCRATARLAAPGMQVSVYSRLGDIPLFNPDLESAPARVVVEFREAIAAADTLIIASPEYAHGVSGAVKNALDWLVSFEGAIDKPVALVNTSPRAHHARDALAEILRTMSMDLIESASISLPLHAACTTEQAMLASSEVCSGIARLLDELASHCARKTSAVASFPL